MDYVMEGLSYNRSTNQNSKLWGGREGQYLELYHLTREIRQPPQGFVPTL